ncbi:MAG TPA: peptidoglycan-binding domain-containing protein, partial [Kofleriaceae bacterium]
IAITNAGSTTKPGEQPSHGPLSQAEMHEFLDDPPARAQPAKGPLSQAEMHEFLDDPSDKAQPTGPARPKAATHADSPWVAAARAYNSRHSDYAAEFNELTSYRYLDVHGGGDNPDDGRKLDPKLVASWQEQHGLQADGMVGPLTVAKAREVRAKPSASAAVAVAPQADARPPV